MINRWHWSKVPQLHNTETVAHILGVRPEQIRRWIRSGRLRGYRMGGGRRLRVPDEALQEFLGMAPEKNPEDAFSLPDRTVSMPSETPQQAASIIRRVLTRGNIVCSAPHGDTIT
jgi:excisionase family DNA binding protein